MSWLQAILIGIMSCTAASTIACLGTTVGNYTLNRPLVASLFVGLILGDVQGCILLVFQCRLCGSHWLLQVEQLHLTYVP